MKIKYLQEGGVPVAPEGAPAPQEQGQDPLLMIAEMFQAGLEQQSCEQLAQGAQMFLELLSQSQGAQAPEAPVYRRGGKFTKVTR